MTLQKSVQIIKEGISVNLETLNEQTLSPTQLFNQLVQISSAKTTSTAGSHTQRFQTLPSLSRVTGPSRASFDIPSSSLRFLQ